MITKTFYIVINSICNSETNNRFTQNLSTIYEQETILYSYMEIRHIRIIFFKSVNYASQR